MFLGVGLDLDRAFVVLAHYVLDRIKIVLAHIPQTAAVVVPVTSECAVHAVRVVRLERSRAKPHLVVELLGHGLRFQVGPAAPVVFPVKASNTADGDLERPAEDTALDEFFDRLDVGAHAVKPRAKTEPCVQAEDPLVLVDRLNDFFALVDCAAHRLLAPDVLARLGGGNGDQRVPVRRSGNMDDIDVLTLQHLAEILVSLNVGPPRFLSRLEMVFVHVANSQQLGLRVDALEVSATHATGTDDGLGDDLAGWGLALAEDVTGDDADGCRRCHGATGKLPTGDLIFMLHNACSGKPYTYSL